MLRYLSFEEVLWVIILSVYVLFIVLLVTRRLYTIMRNRGLKREQAVYYNRKFVHIFAGGVPALLVPLVFTNSIYPLFCGMVLTVFTLFSHRSGHMLYWFQTKRDLNDVTFCFMWGVTIFVLWEVLGNPWIAVIPPAFMAIGDGVTGIIRSFVFERRTKHFIGNIWMAAFCVPIGLYLSYIAENSNGIDGMVFWGVVAAFAASVVERYELGPLDDNVLITVSASLVLLFGSWVGPVL